MSIPAGGFDVAIVGAGICGLAHALAAARRGKRVIVVDRDAQANGASVRNFGFITVTGQQSGDCWRRARRSRDVWVEIATAAGIPVAATRTADDRAPARGARRAGAIPRHRNGRGMRTRGARRDRGLRTGPAHAGVRGRAVQPPRDTGGVARGDPAPRGLSHRAFRRNVLARDGRARRRAAAAGDEPGNRRSGGDHRLPRRRFPHPARRSDRGLWPDALQVAHDAARAGSLRREAARRHVRPRHDPLSRLFRTARRRRAGRAASRRSRAITSPTACI